jgi:O-succinylbenzoic acid--CoA ligase
VLRDGSLAPTLEDVRAALRGSLPDHALPRRIAVLGALPLRGPGKHDRVALRAVFSGRS